jgi:oxygen-independent coproporphyrinogen-3 oxidase
LAELRARALLLGPRRVASVFFGGGTPSLWGAEGIGQVLDAIATHFSIGAAAPEISVECNPTSFSAALGAELVSRGVNRVSLGVQSLDDERLRFLGRLHDAAGGLRAIEQALEAKVPRVSADLIFGVHGQSAEDATREVRTVAEHGVEHLSAYALTIEAGTQFGALHRKGTLPLLPDDTVAESFGAVEETLTSLGFQHYEISNYCRPGRPSQHNVGYWEGREYLGLGCGAWGTIGLRGRMVRYRNTPSIDRYMESSHWPPPSEQTSGPGQPHQAFEELCAETRLVERLMLGLRLAQGVNVPGALLDLGLPGLGDRRLRAIERLVVREQLLWDGKTLAIPTRHWLLADGIIAAVA